MLRSPAELKSRPNVTLPVTLPPGPLHFPLGPDTKHCLSPPLGILASGLSKVQPGSIASSHLGSNTQEF